MQRGDGDFDERRVKLRRQLLARRRGLRIKAYEAAVRRLRDAASELAEDSPDEGADFLRRVLEAVARLPAARRPK